MVAMIIDLLSLIAIWTAIYIGIVFFAIAVGTVCGSDVTIATVIMIVVMYVVLIAYVLHSAGYF